MNKVKLAIMVFTLMGVLLSMAGIFLIFYFNFEATQLSYLLRYVGLGLSILILFIGFHILIVGISSIRGS